jgi:hypothetical protein
VVAAWTWSLCIQDVLRHRPVWTRELSRGVHADGVEGDEVTRDHRRHQRIQSADGRGLHSNEDDRDMAGRGA